MVFKILDVSYCSAINPTAAASPSGNMAFIANSLEFYDLELCCHLQLGSGFNFDTITASENKDIHGIVNAKSFVE